MSLTSILNYNNEQYKEFRALLEELFPLPQFVGETSIKVEPITKNYTLIGTAFDYLIQFALEKKFKGLVCGNKWIAESALRYFQSSQVIGKIRKMDFDTILEIQQQQEECNKLVNEKFNRCKALYNEYISTSIDVSDELLEASLFLGRLDLVFWTGLFNSNKINLNPEKPDNIKDLRLLLGNCDLDLFTPKKKIILNPSFGKGSMLAGGVDAYLIVDNTLIVVKVTKEQKVTRQIYNQVIGCYLLYLIGGVDKHKDVRIENLGIYFARYSSLWTTRIDEVGSKENFKMAVLKLKRRKSRRLVEA